LKIDKDIKINVPKGKAKYFRLVLVLASLPFYSDVLGFIISGEAKYPASWSTTVYMDRDPIGFWVQVIRQLAVGTFFIFVAFAWVTEKQIDKHEDEKVK